MSDSTYDLTLSESLAITYYKNCLSFTQYRMLAEWLGCYNYILPADQHLNESSFSVPPIKNTTSSTLQLFYFQVLLEKHYTSQQQTKITRHILCYLPPPPKQVHNQAVTS